MTEITIALFLATANFAIVNYLADPVRRKFPKLDLWWLIYVSFVTGFAISWLAGVNLFSDYIANDLTSRAVTAMVIGGGSNLIYAIFPEDK